MGQPTIIRLLTLLMLSGVFWFSPAALPRAACAKGVPTIAKVTGPELARPIRSSGPDFPFPVGSWPLPALTGAHHYKAWIYAASSGPVRHDDKPSPEVELGPRYVVTFFVWRQTKTRVMQYLYPFAPSGPLTFTPPGQSRAFAYVFSEREISGWWRAPDELTQWFHKRGIADTIEIEAQRAEMPSHAGEPSRADLVTPDRRC